MEITSDGIGAIKFGMKPSEVKSILGSSLYYEDWMGGNLENFLFYKGLMIGFSGECHETPTENSAVCLFQIKNQSPLVVFGEDVFNYTKDQIEALLASKNLTFKYLTTTVLRVNEIRIQFQFDSVFILDQVGLLKPT